MPKTVLARTGDTLCGLAIDAGFLDCGPLRAEAANSGLLARALSDGDLVTIPDLALKTTSKATDQRHKFVKKNSPPISLLPSPILAGRCSTIGAFPDPRPTSTTSSSAPAASS